MSADPRDLRMRRIITKYPDPSDIPAKEEAFVAQYMEYAEEVVATWSPSEIALAAECLGQLIKYGAPLPDPTTRLWKAAMVLSPDIASKIQVFKP